MSWERRTDEELQTAGKSFSLRDLIYREVKIDLELMSDKATSNNRAETIHTLFLQALPKYG